MLCAGVRVARENQRPGLQIAAETVVDGGCVEERKDIEELRSGAYVPVASIRGKVRLGFVCPERVEAFLDIVLLDDVPIPARCLRVCRIDVGARAIVRQPIRWRSVGQMLEPTVLEQCLVVAAFRNEAGPHADHGMEVHFMKSLIHPDRVWPHRGIHIHFTHFGVMEPIDDQCVDWEVAVAITLSNGHKFSLACITLLTLDVAVSRFGQHGRVAGEQAITRIDLVVVLTCDNKEGHALADIGGPFVRVIEAELCGGPAWVVPKQTVTLTGDGERDAYALAGGRVIVVCAAKDMAAAVEKAFLVLTEAVDVLVS